MKEGNKSKTRNEKGELITRKKKGGKVPQTALLSSEKTKKQPRKETSHPVYQP
jgi:hypothetical protein